MNYWSSPQQIYNEEMQVNNKDCSHLVLKKVFLAAFLLFQFIDYVIPLPGYFNC